MNADQAWTEDDVLGEAGAFDLPAEAKVFDDLQAQVREAAQLLEDAAADEVEAAGAEEVAGLGVGDFPEADVPTSEGLKGSEDGGFHDALDFEGKGDDDMVGPVGLGISEAEGDGARVEFDVSISEEEPWGGGAGGGEGKGVGLSEPAFGEFPIVDDFELVWGGVGFGGDGVHERAGAVSGAVVDGDDLEADSGRGEEGAKGGLDGGFFVAGGDDYGYVWAGAGGGGARGVGVGEVGEGGDAAKGHGGLAEPAEGEQRGEDGFR